MELDFIETKLSDFEANQLNALNLAFVGDAVFEVFVRTYLTDKYREMSVHKLHVKAISFVKAHAQSEFIKGLESELTEQELYIFRRGRNTKSQTIPKNADLQEYRAATGFEAVIGYLFLTDKKERLNFILSSVLEIYNSYTEKQI